MMSPIPVFLSTITSSLEGTELWVSLSAIEQRHEFAPRNHLFFPTAKERGRVFSQALRKQRINVSAPRSLLASCKTCPHLPSLLRSLQNRERIMF